MGGMSNSENELCRFYIMRHGQTEWNVQARMQGHLDSPLTENGINQAKTLSQELAEVEFAHAFSSDLFRAKRTAEIIAADRDLAVKTSQLLRETGFGPFEGKTVKYFLDELKESLAIRESLADAEQMKYRIYPDLETYEETAGRVFTFLRETALANLGENVLVVSHAGTIRALLVKLGFATNAQLPHGKIANTCKIIIESDGIEFFVNEVEGVELTDMPE